MRVLHLIKTPLGAGWALRQIRELVKHGINLYVVFPGGGPMAKKYNEAGAIEHMLQSYFPVCGTWRFPELSAKLSALIKTIKPDIIHSHFVGTTLSMHLSF